MNKRIFSAVTALALATTVAGCASTSVGVRSGLVYDDGSYYSSAADGRGDYYFAPEPRRDDYYFDYFDYFGFYNSAFFFGSPFYSFTGYCSVSYRYCPPFWYGYYGYGYGVVFYPAPYLVRPAPVLVVEPGDDTAGPGHPPRPRPRARAWNPVQPAPANGPMRPRHPVLESSPAPRPRSTRRESERSRDPD